MTNARSFGVSSTVGRAVEDEDAGVDEVRLPFVLVGAQRRQQAERRLEAGAGLRQAQPLAVPQAERAAGERRDVEDRVEAAALVVRRIAVARGDEGRALDPQPVLVDRQLQRAHLRIDVDRLRGDRVVALVAERLVEGVADVPAAEVAVAGPAEVVRLDLVGPITPIGAGRTRNPFLS